MDSVAAKDLACLLAGYCRLLVDPNMNVFRWGGRPKMRRIPVEEGKRGTVPYIMYICAFLSGRAI